ncbi:semaphorin-4B isoform X2 [Hemicordylus capensis]|uniref:semaphorin-4B isoform X2 n=1 Tax=Hemicordylus capensis TaxID=884348 RepID=UPI00230238BD|nr:semaphorin-4B isoform X2 [Hemicordylus capensis]
MLPGAPGSRQRQPLQEEAARGGVAASASSSRWRRQQVQTCHSQRGEAEALPAAPAPTRRRRRRRRRREEEAAAAAAAEFCRLIRARPPVGRCSAERPAAAPRRSRRCAMALRTPRALGWGAAAALLLLLLLGLRLLVVAASEETVVVPRLSLRYDSPHRRLGRFEMPPVTNYTTMVLSPDGRVLYAGAREMLLALDTSAFSPGPQHRLLPWGAEQEKKERCVFKGKDLQRDCHNYVKILLPLNSTHLYACGTSAFSPTCTYINTPDFRLELGASGEPLLEDGKGRCPFDPEYKSTAIMVEGDLYTGTVSNFQGKEPTISRSHSSRPAIKTENSLNWLQDPFFVGSAYLPESLPPSSPQEDDDKVYFFFSETGKEFDFFEDTIVSRIARVCKGDVGGERVLQRRWTTFLKAQLLCSEDGFPFNVLQDMFVLTPGERWQETIFYGVFTSQWKGTEAAAVCAFSMEDVKRAFGGLYKEVNRETQQWYTDTLPVLEPRPGTCISSQTRQMKIASSLQMPDRVLNYLKDHFLMDSAVRSRPVLSQPRARYQQISVQSVRGLRRAYDVLFLGTDDGRLHKAVRLAGRPARVIEELQLFPAGQPVLELLLDQTQGLLYAASYSALVQVPVANCSLYRSCGECLLARDPYCAWSGGACRPTALFHQQPPTVPWLQDIEGADVAQLCPKSSSSSRGDEPPCRLVLLPSTGVRPLPCPLLSNLASRQWLHEGSPLNASSSSSSLLLLPEGQLVLVGSPGQAGRYECWSQEAGFRQLMASYCVRLEQTLQAWLVPVREPLEAIGRSTSADALGGSLSALLEGKSYWTELLVMCVLFGLMVTLLTLVLLHRHRKAMKAFLKQGTCTASHPTKPRKPDLPPTESLPPSGGGGGSLPDHKGYQTLNDSHVASTPVHDAPGTAFSESDRRPLSIRESFVEVLAPSQRPRVRLGSEIRDSVV